MTIKIVSTNIRTNNNPVMASTNPGQMAFWERPDERRLNDIVRLDR